MGNRNIPRVTPELVIITQPTQPSYSDPKATNQLAKSISSEPKMIKGMRDNIVQGFLESQNQRLTEHRRASSVPTPKTNDAFFAPSIPESDVEDLRSRFKLNPESKDPLRRNRGSFFHPLGNKLNSKSSGDYELDETSPATRRIIPSIIRKSLSVSFKQGLSIFPTPEVSQKSVSSEFTPSLGQNPQQPRNKVKPSSGLPDLRNSLYVEPKSYGHSSNYKDGESSSIDLSVISSIGSDSRSRMGSLTYESSISSNYDSPATPVDYNSEHCHATVTPHIEWKNFEIPTVGMGRRGSEASQSARSLRFGQKYHTFYCDVLSPPAIEDSSTRQDESTDEIGEFMDPEDASLSSATPERLVEALTSTVDDGLVTDFFLSYRLFLSPLELCRLLERRFMWALNGKSAKRRVARIRTFIVVRHWVSRYYPQDFLACPKLLVALGGFLDRAGTHPSVVTSEPDLRIVRQMRRCLRRQGEIYGTMLPDPSSIKQRPRSYIASEFGLPNMLQVLPSAIPQDKPMEMDPETWSDDECDHPSDQANEFYGKLPKKGVRGFFNNLQQRARELALKARDRTVKGKAVAPLNHTIQFTPNLSLPDLASKRSFREPNGNALHQHLFQRFAGAFILDHPPELVARQFCIVEQRCLSGVGWQELVEWGTKPMDSTLGIAAVVARFNLTCQWVTSVVVACRRIEDRVSVIERLIQVAHFCHLNRNFSTTLQLVIGLQCGAVARLTRTWDRVSPADMLLLEGLLPYAVPLRNWSFMRQAMESVIDMVPSGLPVSLSSSLGLGVACGKRTSPDPMPESPQDHCGAIPFLGLYLSDLVFNAELETKVEDKVHFSKFRRIAGIVRRVWLFQGLAHAGYTFTPHPKLYPNCLFLPCLSPGEIHQLTLACEP